ncbi:tumor necrosis factor receptor superfamily member 6 isoform X2 [Archocentrus centrarchus]|uniref:tumor necrosis factor receptor superfamily member 6 isoform X2 n=1 Tax=Archocentrus centrarchus TaxID=63155 RepID=UPI0011EA48A7|nr:tumor necrosis factor receptor superfamily member 6-like isoform X2 [Archocentrus centrarchus]
MAARILAFFTVSLCISSVSPRHDPSSIKEIFRNRRETCVDGTYTIYGRTCCLCPAGQRVEVDCTENPHDGKCAICENGTYSSDPSSQKSSNLEEGQSCTPARNRKCRCKKGYFCSTDECTICNPCSTCGIGGIKEDCALSTDTVCNSPAGAIAGIVVLVVILVIGAIVAAGYVVIGRKIRDRKRQKEQKEKGESGTDANLLLKEIPDVDIGPLLPDIANELGWTDMKNIAIRMGVGNCIIESCEIDNQNNAEERTLQLLTRTVEKEGKEAPRKLIQNLEKMNKKGKAEKIIDILSKPNSV